MIMMTIISGHTWNARKGGMCPVYECSKCHSRAIDEVDMMPCFHCGYRNQKLKGGGKKNA